MRIITYSAATLLQLLDENAECIKIAEIAERTGWPRGQVTRKVDTLRKRGFAERVKTGCYRLTDAGRRAKANATPINSGPAGPHTGRRRPAPDSFRSRLWRAHRALRKASIPDLIAMADGETLRDPVSAARCYLKALEGAGYVMKLARRAPGTAPTSNGFHRWLLVKNTGPKAPTWNPDKRELYDPNTGESFQGGAP